MDANTNASVPQDPNNNNNNNISERIFALLTSKEEDTDVRLPRSLKPLHYLVKLQPLIHGNFSVLGYVEVEMEVLEATSRVTLHIDDIVTKNETIRLVPSSDLDGPGIRIMENVYDPKRQFYIALLEDELVPGETYVLSMQFTGILQSYKTGFFRSSYMDEDGKERGIAATAFQATYARRAFPCFDEPEMKAEFEVFLARESSMSSISNMPMIESFPVEDQEGWMWDHFNTSVPMSTYLLAFVVADFVHRDSNASDHIPLRVWARKSAIQQAGYALSIGQEILTFYESYFDVPFPLPKLDIVALPSFPAAALENWGVIAYREALMLTESGWSLHHSERQVAEVVSHDLAHQWFGNLVTSRWWSDIWLSEGFATYMANVAVDHVEPSWQMMHHFILKSLHKALTDDSLEVSQPMSNPVQDPDEIKRNFDQLSYSKGASIIRMMSHFLTEATFRRGLTNFLRTLAFDNAGPDDLWQFLTEAAHEDATLPEDVTVRMIMDTWTLQVGYPVIKVERDAEGTSALLSQERFLMIKNENSTDTHDYKWWVPVTYTSQEAPDFENTQAVVWMNDSEAEITISSLPSKDQWVIFNLQETGFYRVNYDLDNWDLIVQQLKSNHEAIHVINRAQIINDAMDLADAGYLSYNTTLSVISYLSHETEYLPWESMLAGLPYFKRLSTYSHGFQAFKSYLHDLITPVYERMGFEGDMCDPYLEQHWRRQAVFWACELGNQDCVNNSVTLYQQWMQNGAHDSIDPNLEDTVYCTAIAAGGQKEWDFAWNRFLDSNHTRKAGLLTALGCTKEPQILSRYLAKTFTDGSGLKFQDVFLVFVSVLMNDIGRDVAWNYIRDYWENISEYLGSPFALGILLESVAYRFTTEEEKHNLEVFRDENAVQLLPVVPAIERAIGTITNNIAWMDKNYGVIVRWLHDHGYSTELRRL
ncbi:aminopeptidase N-like [Panulirus ornatus]|uniref:aminopeptidase N-like n=1 Tax=Panulirus ornatus TaxID=150431 RepID=UPI003A8AFC86